MALNIFRWLDGDTLSFSLQAFAETIRAELDKFPSDVRDDVVILFSAHSLPLKVEGEGGSGEGAGREGEGAGRKGEAREVEMGRCRGRESWEGERGGRGRKIGNKWTEGGMGLVKLVCDTAMDCTSTSFLPPAPR